MNALYENQCQDIIGTRGGVASAGGGYLLLKPKPSTPQFGNINGVIRLPPKGEWIYEEYIHLDHHFKKKQKNFFREKSISTQIPENIGDIHAKGAWWQNMQKKISEEVDKEFSHKISPEDVWISDIESNVLNLIRDICRESNEDQKNRREQYCRVDS